MNIKLKLRSQEFLSLIILCPTDNIEDNVRPKIQFFCKNSPFCRLKQGFDATKRRRYKID